MLMSKCPVVDAQNAFSDLVSDLLEQGAILDSVPDSADLVAASIHGIECIRDLRTFLRTSLCPMKDGALIYRPDREGLELFAAANGIPPEHVLAECRLNGAGRVESLRFWEREVHDLNELGVLSELTELVLCRNRIEDIAPLASLTRLRYLDLGCNLISNLTPLSGCLSLSYLELNANRFTDISPLAPLQQLTSLNLEKNSITDLSALNGHQELICLLLSGTQVENLEVLFALQKLNILSFRTENPEINAQIKQLGRRGVHRFE